MQKVQTKNLSSHGIELHLIDRRLIIKKDQMSCELTQPPFTSNQKFQSIKDFYDILVGLPHEKMFIVHQYILIDVAGELITIKLRYPNSHSEQNSEIRLIEASQGRLLVNEQKAKRINYSFGFLNEEVHKKGNCMGIILSIFRGQGKRYILSFNTCYFIAFNIAIFNDEMLKNTNLTLQYSCVLVSTFQDEAKRSVQPMVEYGQVKGIVLGSHFSICNIEQNQEVFQNVGYLPLKFFDNNVCYTDYCYSKQKNRTQYGSAFWSYGLYRIETHNSEVTDPLKTINITKRLNLHIKNKSFIKSALSQVSQPHYKTSQQLFAKMQIYYNQIHLINHRLIDEQLVEKKDNDTLGRNISILVRQREKIYYRLGNFENKYTLSLDEKQKEDYQLHKQERLTKYSQQKAKQYGRLFDQLIGTRLRINEHIVHRQEKNYDRSLSKARKLIQIVPQRRQTIKLSYILEAQAQFRDNYHEFIKILKEMEQKPFIQTYLLNAFYIRYNRKIFDLNLPQLLRIQQLIKTSFQNHIHHIQQPEIIYSSGKQDIKFISSKNTNFYIRDEMEYSLSYEDDYYIYRLDIDILNQDNKKRLLQSLNLSNLQQVYNYFLNNKGKIKIFSALGFIIIDNKEIIELKRYRKPIIKNCQDHPLIFNEKEEHQIKENIKQNWKSRQSQSADKTSLRFSSVQILYFWEDLSYRKIRLQKHSAYLIGMNGVISNIKKQQNCRLLNSFGYFSKSDSYLRIGQWTFINSANQTFSISLGLFQDLNAVSRISQGYLGLQFYEDKYLLNPVQTDQSSQINSLFNNSVKIMTSLNDSLPFLEVNTSQLMSNIRKGLSQLSNFQIFCQEIVRNLVRHITTDLCQSYKIRKQFQDKSENSQQFRKALQEGNASQFFSKRNKAIEQYQKIISLHKYLEKLINDFQLYSSKNLQESIRVKIIQDFQKLLNLKPLQLLDEDIKSAKVKQATYDNKQETYQCIEAIKKEKNRLEKQKCYLQVHMLSRFLEDVALAKGKNVEKNIYLIENADIKTNFTKSNLKFYEQYTQYKLPRVIFHNILEEAHDNRVILCEDIKKEANFENAMIELMKEDEQRYYSLTDELLNESLSRNQQLISHQNLHSLYQYAVMPPDKKLNDQETYMRYLFYMYASLKHQYTDFQFYYLEHRSNRVGEIISDNQIKSKLTLMQLINGFASKEPINNYQIQCQVPADKKLEITDLKDCAVNYSKGFKDQIRSEEIKSFRRVNRKMRDTETKRIKMFIKSVQTLRWKQGNKINKQRKGFLTISDFEYEFNYYYRPKNELKKVEIRGGFPYYSPTYCMKLALKAFGKYDNNNWYGKHHKKGQWAIAYHGLREPLKRINPNISISESSKKSKDTSTNCSNSVLTTQTQPEYSNCVQNIIRTNLMPGINNVYQNAKCLTHQNCIVGDGIYVTPSFRQTLTYTSNNQQSIQMNYGFQKQVDLIMQSPQSNQTKQSKISRLKEIFKEIINPRQKYSLVFMNRLNPKDIHVFDRTATQRNIKKSSKNLYWVVNQPESCRTYAIMLINNKYKDTYPKMQDQFGQTFHYEHYRKQIQDWNRNQTLPQTPQQVPPLRVTKTPKAQDISKCEIY